MGTKGRVDIDRNIGGGVTISVYEPIPGSHLFETAQHGMTPADALVLAGRIVAIASPPAGRESEQEAAAAAVSDLRAVRDMAEAWNDPGLVRSIDYALARLRAPAPGAEPT